jgi:uncharacterized membrane protein
MDHGKFIFLIFLAMVLVIVSAFILHDGTYNHGEQHPDHIELDQGGDGTRHQQGHTLLLGVTFGVLQIILFVTLLSFGLRAIPQQRITLLVGAIIYLGIFLAMVLSYHATIAGGVTHPPKLFLGLPVATAWMIYGLGGIPLFFALLYVIRFDRWVLTPEDHQVFRDAVEEARSSAPSEITVSADADSGRAS